MFTHDSLYLWSNIILNLFARVKPLWHTCVSRCDPFCLRLSWLVCHSDEEGNIRRMIYVYDISFVCPTACSYSIRWLLCPPNSSSPIHQRKPQTTLRYDFISLFPLLPLCCWTTLFITHCFMHYCSWQCSCYYYLLDQLLISSLNRFSLFTIPSFNY